MTFDEAVQQLAQWVAESNGTPIRLPKGTVCEFQRTGTCTEEDLRVFEERWGIPLPAAYRRLLLEVGPGRFFFHDWPKGPEFGDIYLLAPAELYTIFEQCFDEPEEVLFAKLLPIGTDGHLQELLVFATDREPPRHFMRVWHETHPEDWVPDADEGDDWLTLEQYVIRLVELEGHLTVSDP